MSTGDILNLIFGIVATLVALLAIYVAIYVATRQRPNPQCKIAFLSTHFSKDLPPLDEFIAKSHNLRLFVLFRQESILESLELVPAKSMQADQIVAAPDVEAANLPLEQYSFQLQDSEQGQPLMGQPTIREDERHAHHALGDVLEAVSRMLRSQSS